MARDDLAHPQTGIIIVALYVAQTAPGGLPAVLPGNKRPKSIRVATRTTYVYDVRGLLSTVYLPDPDGEDPGTTGPKFRSWTVLP